MVPVSTFCSIRGVVAKQKIPSRGLKPKQNPPVSDQLRGFRVAKQKIPSRGLKQARVQRNPVALSMALVPRSKAENPLTGTETFWVAASQPRPKPVRPGSKAENPLTGTETHIVPSFPARVPSSVSSKNENPLTGTETTDQVKSREVASFTSPVAKQKIPSRGLKLSEV